MELTRQQLRQGYQVRQVLGEKALSHMMVLGAGDKLSVFDVSMLDTALYWKNLAQHYRQVLDAQGYKQTLLPKPVPQWCQFYGKWSHGTVAIVQFYTNSEAEAKAMLPRLSDGERLNVVFELGSPVKCHLSEEKIKEITTHLWRRFNQRQEKRV